MTCDMTFESEGITKILDNYLLRPLSYLYCAIYLPAVLKRGLLIVL